MTTSPEEKPSAKEVLDEIRATKDALIGLPARLQEVEDRGKTTRYISYVLAALLIVAGGLILNERSSRIEDKAKLNQNYLVSGCESGNEQRALELTFWLGAVADSAKKPENQTPEGKKRLADYRTQLYKAYPQLDCSKVKDGERVVIAPTGAPNGKS